MMDGATGRALRRLFGLLALTGLVVGCAGTPQGTVYAPADFGKDEASRAERLVRYCDRLAGEGKYLTALGLCARAHEINPDNPETLMKIAALLQTLDRDDAAAETYTTLLAQHPSHQEALYSLGKVYMESGRNEQAAQQFNRAMVSDPEDPRPYNALGIIRDQAGEHQAAQALYRSALEQDPANVSARNNLGLSLALNGDREQAIEVLAGAAVEPGVDETVLNNLEAAYATMNVGPAPAAGGDPSAPPPVEPGLAPQAINRPASPVAVEPLENHGVAGQGQVPAAPSDPADNQGPIPLLAPATAGEPEQTSALPPRAEVVLSAAGGDLGGSVIGDAVARLMAPPAWADFEPGDLLNALPAAPPRRPVENHDAVEDDQEPAEEAVEEEAEIVEFDSAAAEEAPERLSAAAPSRGADPYYLSLMVTRIQ